MKKYLVPGLVLTALAVAFALIVVLMEWSPARVVGALAIGAGLTALSFWLYRRMYDDEA